MPDDTHAEATQARFSASAELMAEHEESRREELRAQIRQFLEPTGEERVLDAGAGTGGFSFAAAPLVREVVAADVVPEVLDTGREVAAYLSAHEPPDMAIIAFHLSPPTDPTEDR